MSSNIIPTQSIIDAMPDIYERYATKFICPEKYKANRPSLEKGDMQWLHDYDRIIKKMYLVLHKYYGDKEFRPVISCTDRLLLIKLNSVNEEYKKWLKGRNPKSNIYSMYTFPDRWVKFFKRMRKLGLITCSFDNDNIPYYKLDLTKVDKVTEDVFIDYI